MKLTATIFAFTVAVAAACDTQPWGQCGNSHGAGCCPDEYYCQPWSDGYYQCMPTPEQCSGQVTDVEWTGETLSTLYGIQPADCCAKCASTDGCQAYTFINNNPGSPKCVLKRSKGNQKRKVGAVSGVRN
ncbi:TPA: hypothetical protein N0F65_007982 [Lagenidium giganteum]|uniref:CBEL n=1 Tax=Lagenidium giganteum TaxID=4803 RepID=W0G5H4_9STRA|nr:CBEL [Lagenidium giganteum]DAZ93078.1 TPA: hypothetical protein N0F65_007982 [Lagenidium giganteum]